MANIPPQLEQELPETAAAALSQFCEMAPGIPWSNQILDDMLETLKSNSYSIPSKLALSPPVDGITKIEANLIRAGQRVKKEWKAEVRAMVHYYCGRQNQHGYEHSGSFEKTFPMDRTGLKKAIEFLQETVQNVKRRGLCETCLASDPPRKRLRVGAAGLCTTCLVTKAAFA